ncbi:hypothetical protein NXW10_02820 [Bacteroides fragilis]|nr:hypothetical protein NXW10_02820 [Bacteroides fragilis]
MNCLIWKEVPMQYFFFVFPGLQYSCRMGKWSLFAADLFYLHPESQNIHK